MIDSYEPIGYLASLLVLATFCMREMVLLRAIAIASNLAFIGYGALAGIEPVLMLHLVLLPTNLLRLMQALRERRRDAASMGVVQRHRRAAARRRTAPRCSRPLPLAGEGWGEGLRRQWVPRSNPRATHGASSQPQANRGAAKSRAAR